MFNKTTIIIMERKTNFSMKEVKQLVKNAYEVGYCDGVDGDGTYSPDADKFWDENIEYWLTHEIMYPE